MDAIVAEASKNNPTFKTMSPHLTLFIFHIFTLSTMVNVWVRTIMDNEELTGCDSVLDCGNQFHFFRELHNRCNMYLSCSVSERHDR